MDLNTEELIKSLEINKNLVISFFYYFSRFEYALKRGGYFKKYKEKNRINADPDWDTYIKEIHNSFNLNKNREVKEAVEYLTKNPPKKQYVVNNRNLEWKEVQKNGNKIMELKCVIKRVRNNLFHGGKYVNNYISDPSRDEKLLYYSIVLLKEFAKLDKNVEYFFKDNYLGIAKNDNNRPI